MRSADQIEAVVDRAVADLTAVRTAHTRRRGWADDENVDGTPRVDLSDEAGD